MKTTSFLFFCAILAATAPLEATVRLPHLLSDGMVLQRGDTVRLWGDADPHEQVTVHFRKKSYTTQAADDGTWQLSLPPQKAGGPYDLQVGNVTLHDIYVGDVWLTSGQSNMDLQISRVHDLYGNETDRYSNPKIHLIQIETRSLPEAPQRDLGGTEHWEALSPDVSGHWSAVSYFFAQELFEATGVPQGIINASQGGSAIEGWMSRAAINSVSPRASQELEFCLTEGYMERCKALNAAISQKYEELKNSQDPGVSGRWMSESLDDSDWEEVDPFDLNLGTTYGRPWRGTLWFRKEFTIPDSLAGAEALLRLGCLVDADVAYINGEQVGVTYYQYPPRKYKVRAGLLHAGRNTLCIRLTTAGGATKFVREKPYRLEIGNTQLPLADSYRMKRGVMMPAQPGVGSFDNLATGYYNGMIAPLLSYRIAGIVWYQGETNTGRPNEYEPLLQTLASDWRSAFGAVPLLVVQLANFMERHTAPVESNWAALRDAQRRAANSIPNAALATAVDLGEWNDIHPLNKKDLAHRLALQARRLYLGEKKLVAEGPAYEHCEARDRKIYLTFRNGTDDFQTATRDGDLAGFTIAGADKRFRPARARIEGKQVVVWSDKVAQPLTVRYGWDDNPLLSLYGANGLPAATFEAHAQ